MGRTGKPCRRTAGWGTDHVGYGTCKLHLGSSKKHGIAAARMEALQFARGALGQELDVDPLEGVLIAVRLSYGVVDFWRHELQKTNVPVDSLQESYSRALMEYARICDIAIKAGVAERQIRIMERASEELSLLFEEMAAAANATVEQRERMREAFVRGLERFEQPAIEATSRDVAA